MEPAHTPVDPLGLYFSIPFCRSKCTFCNFASGVYPPSQLELYLSRLLDDLANAHSWARQQGLILPRQVDTVYFGGGTPSLLAPAQLAFLLAAVRAHFSVSPAAEITLEAAPGFLSEDLLAACAGQGVTRISFGVQTFVDAEARGVGRLHTAAQAMQDVARARSVGMAVSLDLIAGLPGQTESSWRHSLQALCDLAPEHASVYMLEVDEDSRLGGEMLLGGTRYGAALTPSDDAVADFYQEACLVLAANGLEQYEISNFARHGHPSRHNQRYWQRRPYLGLGLDAHSMLRTTGGQAVRFGSTEDLDHYLRPPAPHQALHRLTRQEELEEAWFLGLRCNSGVALEAIRVEFGPAALAACMPALATLAADGLLSLGPSRAALTSRGRLLSNEVFSRLLGIEAEELPIEAREPVSSSFL
ncbi:MAG TPA: radical SAM family heme chaperone HemW [Acidobacteriaceae bacterium]